VGDCNEDYAIERCQYTAGDFKYDVTVFRNGSEYHAAWYCPRCLTRAETLPIDEWNSAKQEAQDAIGAHHFAKHAPGKSSAAAPT
jgi:hypothetical protein